MQTRDDAEPRLYTVPQVADVLHVHATTVRRYIAAGELGSVKIGRTRRVTQQQLDTFVRAHFDSAE